MRPPCRRNVSLRHTRLLPRARCEYTALEGKPLCRGQQGYQWGSQLAHRTQQGRNWRTAPSRVICPTPQRAAPCGAAASSRVPTWAAAFHQLSVACLRKGLPAFAKACLPRAWLGMHAQACDCLHRLAHPADAARQRLHPLGGLRQPSVREPTPLTAARRRCADLHTAQRRCESLAA